MAPRGVRGRESGTPVGLAAPRVTPAQSEVAAVPVTWLVLCDAALEEIIFAKNRPQMHR